MKILHSVPFVRGIWDTCATNFGPKGICNTCGLGFTGATCTTCATSQQFSILYRTTSEPNTVTFTFTGRNCDQFTGTKTQSLVIKMTISHLYYRPQTKFAKAMFLQVSVHTGWRAWLLRGGGYGCSGGVGVCGCSRGDVCGCLGGGGGHAWMLWGSIRGIWQDTEIWSMSGRYASYWNAFLFWVSGYVTPSVSFSQELNQTRSVFQRSMKMVSWTRYLEQCPTDTLNHIHPAQSRFSA